jgi:23S rRNA pseudouridine955/2504/2580 synthase
MTAKPTPDIPGNNAAGHNAHTGAKPLTPLVVTREEAGQKLLQYLTRRLGREVPGAAILRAIRKGEVRVDGGRKQPFFRLAEGQQVRVPPFTRAAAEQAAGPAPEHTPSAPETPALDILFEDADLLAVLKPAGLCSHAGTRHSDSVAGRLAARHAGAAFTPGLGHRLDKDTSGILLAGKTYAALRRLNELFATGGVKKTYLAWVDGVWPEAGEPQLLEDVLERQDLAHGAADRKKVQRADEGKIARCEVTTLVRKRSATLLMVRLLTGRTHQIRVQLATRGHAVISDAVYGRKVRGLPMLLHAVCLRLPERALFAPPPAHGWSGPFALPGKLLDELRERLGA